VLGAVRSLNRPSGGSAAVCFAVGQSRSDGPGSPRGDGCAIETFRAALNALAAAAPEWLRAQADPAWVERHARPADDCRVPKGDDARRAYAEGIGCCGHALLAAVAAPDAPTWLREGPSVVLLRRVWIQNFCLMPAEAGAQRGTNGPGEDGMLVRWRTAAEGFPASPLMRAPPYDPDVHHAKKRGTPWIGCKVHLTETCDDERPHLITHVETISQRSPGGTAREAG